MHCGMHRGIWGLAGGAGRPQAPDSPARRTNIDSVQNCCAPLPVQQVCDSHGRERDACACPAAAAPLCAMWGRKAARTQRQGHTQQACAHKDTAHTAAATASRCFWRGTGGREGTARPPHHTTKGCPRTSPLHTPEQHTAHLKGEASTRPCTQHAGTCRCQAAQLLVFPPLPCKNAS